MNRRNACKLMAGSAGSLLLSAVPGTTSAMTVNPIAGDRLYQHVLEYTRIGEHRTGTAGDLATSSWVRQKFDSFGLDSSLLPVGLNLFEVDSAFLEIDHARFRADPEWYPTGTTSEGVTAPMRMLGPDEDYSVLRGCIWVLEVQMERPVVPREVKERALKAAAAGAVGIVMVLRFRSTELIGRGAHGEYGQRPWISIPLVGVAAKHEAVVSAARQGAMARLVVQGKETTDASAFNVMGTKGTGEKHIIVTTPQSGMFRCGGERGGGIALLLGLAEWTGRRDSRFRYIFSTNTGHEQDGSGAHKLVSVVPEPEKVVAWLHLGSGISTWNWRPREDGTWERFAAKSGVRNFGAVEVLRPLLAEAFLAIPDLEPQSVNFQGELRHYVAAGYPAFGFWGYNHYGHTDADGPEQVAPVLLEPVAQCLVRALEALEKRA